MSFLENPNMDIPIVIHKDAESTYGATVPDIPGCYSHGDTIDEAITNAKEAIYNHITISLELNEPVSIATSKIENLIQDPEHAGGIWALVNDILISVGQETPIFKNSTFPNCQITPISHPI